jgi:Fe-S cluster biogenesis protein NfuA
MEIEQEINMVLDKIRPFLQRDGGDLELAGFENGIAYIKMIGACEGCGMVGTDLTEGVAAILQEEVPGVLGVLPASLYHIDQLIEGALEKFRPALKERHRDVKYVTYEDDIVYLQVYDEKGNKIVDSDILTATARYLFDSFPEINQILAIEDKNIRR